MTHNNSSSNPVPNFYRASAADFKKIPGSPIAYWASKQQRNVFQNGRLLGEIASPRQGIATANNDLFLRRWYELSLIDIHFLLENKEHAIKKGQNGFHITKVETLENGMGMMSSLSTGMMTAEKLEIFGIKKILFHCLMLLERAS